MITIRKSTDRGHADHGWLDTHHTFAFAGYYDPEHVHFRSLRVINEDRVAPGAGFGTHPHRDMEILTWVLSGALEHRDNMGNGGVIRPGDIQRMSAGTGVTHSEYNHSADEPVHFLQIWIMPERAGIEPGYEQRTIPEPFRRNSLRLIAGPDANSGAVLIHQDARVYNALLEAGSTLEHVLAPGRFAWLQVARGSVRLNDVVLEVGDGAAVSEEVRLEIAADDDAELLLFDLA